jgi:hypothetical protein
VSLQFIRSTIWQAGGEPRSSTGSLLYGVQEVEHNWDSCSGNESIA